MNITHKKYNEHTYKYSQKYVPNHYYCLDIMLMFSSSDIAVKTFVSSKTMACSIIVLYNADSMTGTVIILTNIMMVLTVRTIINPIT